MSAAPMPRAVASGLLWGELECHVLEDERPLVTQRALVTTLRGVERGTGAEYGNLTRFLARLPSRYAYLSAEPSIAFSLQHGPVAIGRPSSFFTAVLMAYVDAHARRELHYKQEPIALRAVELVELLVGKAIDDLIYEACSYRRPVAAPLPDAAQAAELADAKERLREAHDRIREIEGNYRALREASLSTVSPLEADHIRNEVTTLAELWIAVGRARKPNLASARRSILNRVLHRWSGAGRTLNGLPRELAPDVFAELRVLRRDAEEEIRLRRRAERVGAKLVQLPLFGGQQRRAP